MSKFRGKMESRIYLSFLLALVAVFAWHACGGGGSGVSTAPPPPPPTEQTITLGFDPPTTYTDGTPITNISGYILYYGQSPGTYSHSIDVGNVSTYSITLPLGTWYFSAKAHSLAGTESDFSNEIEVKL